MTSNPTPQTETGTTPTFDQIIEDVAQLRDRLKTAYDDSKDILRALKVHSSDMRKREKAVQETLSAIEKVKRLTAA